VTKEEIIAAVRGNCQVVIWLTDKASYIHIPFSDLLTWWGRPEEAIERAKKQVIALGFPYDEILFVEGATGIAALDPKWDGSDTFLCETSNCTIQHSVDQLFADRLFQKFPPEVKLYELGLKSCEVGDYEGAVRAFQEVVGLKPEFSANAWERLGFAYYKLRRLDQAVEAYSEAIRLKPEFKTAWYNFGVAYAAQGNRAKVMETYNNLQTLDKSVADEFFRKCFPRGSGFSSGDARS
jgi:tetratricopeptide (TPR) repeat protein